MTNATKVDSLDRSIQKTNEWIRALVDQGDGLDERQAYHVMRATLHSLRDRLPSNEAVQLAAQFPLLVRGVYYEGWRPDDKPYKVRHREEFLALVRERIDVDLPIDTETAVRSVFRLLSEKVSEGEIEDVRGNLPQDIQKLWGELTTH